MESFSARQVNLSCLLIFNSTSSSDSDLTDCCASELDTGQDAGDECDTDELLDIDFIDTSSMQEVELDRKDLSRNLGNCHYYSNHPISPVLNRKASVRSRRKSGQETGKAPNSADARGSLKHVRRVVKIAKRLLRHLFVSLVAPEVWVARPSVCAAIYWVQVRGIRQQFNNYI